MADLLSVRDGNRSGPTWPLTAASLSANSVYIYLMGQEQNQMQMKEKPNYALMHW